MSTLHRLVFVLALVNPGPTHRAHAEDAGADASPTVLEPHRLQIVVPAGWTWTAGSFVHTSGARATIEVSVAIAGGVDARYCELQVSKAELDILGNARDGDVPEDLGPPPARGWPAWLPVNDGRDMMTCGRVALPRPPDASPVDVLTGKYGTYDIKVVLTGRNLAAGNALVAALALAQPAGAKPPPPKPSTPSTPKTLLLPLFGVDLQLPDDGMTWSLKGSREDGGLIQVSLARLAPAKPPLEVMIVRAARDDDRLMSCSEAVSKFPAATSLSGLPAGWRHHGNPGAPDDTHLCIEIATKPLLLAFTPGPLSDLAPFAPLLKAIEAAFRPPVTPSVPGYSYSGSEKSIMMASGGLEVAMSWRDSSDKTIPSLRASFPGFEYSWLFATASGFVHRGNLAAAVDILGVFSDDVTLSPRFGGQHVELGLDFGFSFALGDTTRLGLTAGWHGVVGPITKNSSIALSAIFASYLDDELGLSVRVTPVQLFAANERELMSPLTVDVRVMLGILALGLEFQYIAPPRPGDEDIPAEAMAFILRFGAGFGRPY